MLKYAAALGNEKGGKLRPGCQAPAGSVVQRDIYMLGEDFTAIKRQAGKDRRILTPDILTSPFPAHGIVHAYPIEPCYLITRESGMYYESNWLTRKLSTGSVSFYPSAIPCCTKPT